MNLGRCFKLFLPRVACSRTLLSVATRSVAAHQQGLFGIEELYRPAGFQLMVNRVKSKCTELCAEVFSRQRRRKVVAVFDEMSDYVCSVADMAECVRLLHPDIRYVQAAEDAVIQLGELIEKLNTDAELYVALRDSVVVGDVGSLDNTDRLVAELLVQDFELSGVNLDESDRQKFINLTGDVFKSGAEFVRGCEAPVLLLEHSVPAEIKRHCQPVGDRLMSLDSPLSGSDEVVRKEAYLRYYAPNDEQERYLKHLLNSRFALSQLAGFPSFSHRALRNHVLDTPEKVRQFLLTILDRAKDNVDEELAVLRRYSRRPMEETLVWDIPFLTQVAKQDIFKINAETMQFYFEKGSLLDGLNEVLRKLYDVSLVHCPVHDGEVWDKSVTKMAILATDRQILGYVYIDWYERPGKVCDSHFTIRCGRQLTDGTYQTPVVVLSMRCNASEKVPFLTLTQLENFMHEMGHALHSIFGRTKYQHVAGTRCATDFAEVPSNLMERFLYDTTVLSSLTSGKCKDTAGIEFLNCVCSSRTAFAAIELVQQSLFALCDLELHLHRVDSSSDTADLCRSVFIQHGYGSFMPKGTAWNHRFSHLVPYGSKYHTYLVARAAASLIWRRLFEKDPLNSDAGARWRRVQAFGGQLKSDELLGEALGYRPTSEHLADTLVLDTNWKSARKIVR